MLNNIHSMKKIVLFASVLLLLASCVSMKEYEALQNQHGQTTKSLRLTKQELDETKELNAELIRQNQALQTDVHELSTAKLACEASVDSLRNLTVGLRLHYDTTVENYMQQITGKNRDLNKANQLLDARTRELNEKERAFRVREAEMLKQQQALEVRQVQLEQEESAARKALADKEAELEHVRKAVSHALVGFSDKGLNVETKEGKVYVSMADKLLFASGSWTVSKEGMEAIKNLAKVLEENKELNIMVEGHTDNVAFKGSGSVKDNWDLSVMRATTIVKLLLQAGPKIDPSRVEACGHGEYAPKVANTSTANKAINRRTEIILTPRLTDLLKIVK